MKTIINFLATGQSATALKLVFGKYNFQPQPLYWAMVPAKIGTQNISAIK